MKPNVVDDHGDTPADKAAENGHEEALKLLLKVREGSAWGGKPQVSGGDLASVIYYNSM